MKTELIFSQKLNSHLTKDFLSYDLINFADSNFTRDIKDYKLLIKYYFFLNKTVVSKYSKKQKAVFILIIESKYNSIEYVVR